MKKISEAIIFFGSGPVAAKSLRSLYENFTIKAVVTKPQPPHHKYVAPVIEFAQEKSLDVYYVRDKDELNGIFESGELVDNVRLGVLVDFGIILPQPILNHFRLGIVNSHFSLLPTLRGADPITFAILSGQRVTGVSLMLVVRAMDEGPLLAQETYRLPANITTPQLTEDLIKLSNNMLAKVIPLYLSGKISPIEQDKTVVATYSRKLTKEDGIIDWNKGAEQLEREIRAFTGWPKSHTSINGVEVIITVAHVSNLSGLAGKAEEVNKRLVIHCGDKSLIIDRIKPSGKTEMSGEEFLRGYPL